MSRFIIDAHFPKKLCDLFVWKGYDAIHTSNLPNKNRTKDSEINQISLEQKRVLITKDLDFTESLLISIKPYVSTGNIINRELLELFGKNLEKIVKAIEDNRLVEVNSKTIIVRG